MQASKSLRLPVFALGEWLLILPATLFLATAALRLLQPRQYEPARTSWLIFDWAMAHMTQLGAAILFLAVPALVVIAGCIVLRRAWRNDESVRADVVLWFSVLRRRLAVALLASATLAAAAVLVLAVSRLFVD